MATNLDFIDDDIEVIEFNEVDSLDVTAMGNAFIRYADSNYPTKQYYETSDLVMNPNKDYYEIVEGVYVLSGDTEFITGKQYYEFDGVYKTKNNNKGFPHSYVGIYVGISEPIEEVESEVYNWALRDTTTIDALIKALQESKQDKLTLTQMQAVNSGINSEKVAKYDNYESKINDKQDKLTAIQLNAVNSNINSYKVNTYDAHVDNKDNPHNVTKQQLGLENVVNTGDSAEPTAYGTTKFTTGGAYNMKRELDSSIETVRNAVNRKQDRLVSGQNIKTINGQSVLGSGNLIFKLDPSQPIQDFNYDGTNTLKQVMDTKLDAANLQVCVGYEVIEEGE